jgi:signal transduction histidine kinase/DNA-binding NarL/FixJ family response regulator
MAEEDDFLTLIEDEPVEVRPPSATPWKIAIIDDDPAVHDGTRFALYDYVLNGQGLEILSAYSAQEGRELMRAHPDMAVVLLDVVMESEAAGLDLVDYIRNELRNETVRIILRTGQPGQAPERRVIVDYDINDYKAKTELTADKLFTTLTAALRSHQQLQRMVATRRGLEIIIDAAARLFDFRSMQRLAEGVLTQIASLLNVDCAGILVLREEGEQSSFSILAGSGCYSRFVGKGGPAELDPTLRQLVQQAFERRVHEFQDERSVLYIGTGSGREVVVILEAGKNLSETDRTLVEVFCSRLSTAFDNVILYEQLQRANASLEERVQQRTRELMQANERLAVQSEQLRHANRFKSEILGTVAHDLKNPLGVILGRAEMLGELLAAKPFQKDAAGAQIAHIRESAKRLTEMVDTLIADAMSDALDIRIRKEPLDLKMLVAEVAGANRTLADLKDQKIRLVQPKPVMALGDHDRLAEAVDNLVSNAIKYSPRGAEIEVKVAHGKNQASIKVKDQGPGLTREDMSRLFGRFQRLSAQPTAGESSTGLGLSIAKRIVELHGGTIEATSEGPGKGATFEILLPTERWVEP